MAKRAAKTDETKEIIIPRPDIQQLEVTLVGITPLVTCRITEYCHIQRPGDNTENQKKLADFSPDEQYKLSRYMIDPKTHGFPSSSVKKAMVSAVRMLGVAGRTQLSMVAAKPMFTTFAKEHHKLMRLTFSKVERDDDVGKIPKTGTPIPIYRAVYYGWSCPVMVQFDAHLISAETILHLLAKAGQVGIGAKRPECNGSNGMFEVKESTKRRRGK